MFRLSARGPSPTTGPLHHLGSGGGADRRRVGTRLALGEDAERVLARDLAEARGVDAGLALGVLGRDGLDFGGERAVRGPEAEDLVLLGHDLSRLRCVPEREPCQ